MVKILNIEPMVSYVPLFLEILKQQIESGEVAVTSVHPVHRDNLPYMQGVPKTSVELKENLFAVWEPGKAISHELAAFVSVHELHPLVEEADVIFIEEDLFCKVGMGQTGCKPGESGADMVKQWEDAGIDLSGKVLIGSSDLPQPYVKHHSFYLNEVEVVGILTRLGILSS